MKFGVSMCYFSNKKVVKFARKRTKYGFFMIYQVLRQRSKKKTDCEKNKLSFFIVMILKYTKNLRLNFFNTMT